MEKHKTKIPVNMKLSVSFFLVVICTMCLAAQQSQAKKGCNAYGYACYGGHGKRSLPTQEPVATDIDRNDFQELADNMVQVYPSEANVVINDEVEEIPTIKFIEVIKSYLKNRQRDAERQQVAERERVAERQRALERVLPGLARFFNLDYKPETNNSSFK